MGLGSSFPQYSRQEVTEDMSIHLRHAAACYQAPDGEVEAVRDVSFDLEEMCIRDSSARAGAGTDCHVAPLLAMTV